MTQATPGKVLVLIICVLYIFILLCISLLLLCKLYSPICNKDFKKRDCQDLKPRSYEQPIPYYCIKYPYFFYQNILYSLYYSKCRIIKAILKQIILLKQKCFFLKCIANISCYSQLIFHVSMLDVQQLLYSHPHHKPLAK